MRKRTKILLIALLVLVPAITWAIAAGDQEVSGDLHVNGGEFFLGTGTATTTFSTTGTVLTVTSGVASSSAANVIVSGNLGIGTTTASSNRLTIDSGSGSALAIRNSGSKTFEILNTGLLYTYAAASTYDMWNSQVNGESFARAIYNADGLIEWGSGSATTDTNLYRSAANSLRTDDTFVVGSAFQQLAASDSYFTGDLGVGTTNPDGLQINRAVSETARSADNVRLGVNSGTPRIILEDNTYTQWEIDNFAGTLRFFTPGSVKLSLNTSGQLVTIDNGWIGLGSGAGRIEFDDQATDEVNILNANVGIGTTTPPSLLTLEPSSTTATSTLEISNKGSTTNGSCIQMHSPNGTRYRLYVSNAGVLTTEAGKCQ